MNRHDEFRHDASSNEPRPAPEENGRWPRERLLPRLIGVGPEEIADDSRAGRLAVLKRLSRALRRERVLGRAGHWSYSLDRHVGLVRAVAAERRELAAVPAAASPGPEMSGARAGPPPTGR